MTQTANLYIPFDFSPAINAIESPHLEFALEASSGKAGIPGFMHRPNPVHAKNQQVLSLSVFSGYILLLL
jgi:hypothetical protein